MNAHQYNIDVAQRELDRRNAEGEDVSHLVVCQRTAQIVTWRPTIEKMVLSVRAHAITNFNSGKGWDYVSECWTKEDIAEQVKNCRSVAGAIKKVGKACAALAAYGEEVRGGEW